MEVYRMFYYIDDNGRRFVMPSTDGGILPYLFPGPGVQVYSGETIAECIKDYLAREVICSDEGYEYIIEKYLQVARERNTRTDSRR
jgi:hypothetical protein